MVLILISRGLVCSCGALWTVQWSTCLKGHFCLCCCVTVQAGGQGAGPGGHTRKRVTMKDKFIKKPTIGVTAPGEVRGCVVTVGDGGAKVWEGEGMACRGDRLHAVSLEGWE